jgi:ABC-type antimicrobial peptide transport system permease subunit
VRTRGNPAQYAAPARGALTKLDRSLLITNVTTLGAIVEDAQTGTRFSLFLISAFAAIAALLAGVGLYGVLSTVVRQRTAEIGVRMALGATPSGIFGLMIAYGLRLSVAGIAAELVAALLVGIKPTDPQTFSAMVMFFVLIAGARHIGPCAPRGSARSGERIAARSSANRCQDGICYAASEPI